MAEPPRAFRIGSIIWSIAIGIGVLVLAVGVILPSTKKSRLDFKMMERIQEQERQMRENAATGPADTEPATQP